MLGLLISLLIPILVFLMAVPSWANIEYVGGQTGGFNGTASSTVVTFSLTGGLASTPAASDFVVVTYCTAANSDDAMTIKDPATTDYTAFGVELYANDNVDVNMETSYKVMGGTPDADVTLGPTGGLDDAAVYTIQVFRGVHATPLEQAVAQGTITNTHMPTFGAITPTTGGTIVIIAACGTSGADNNGAVYTSSDLSAFLSTYQQTPGGADFDGMVGAGYFPWVAGAYTAAAFGGGGSDSVSDSGTAKIIAIKPASFGVNTCNGGMAMLGAGRAC